MAWSKETHDGNTGWWIYISWASGSSTMRGYAGDGITAAYATKGTSGALADASAWSTSDTGNRNQAWFCFSGYPLEETFTVDFRTQSYALVSYTIQYGITDSASDGAGGTWQIPLIYSSPYTDGTFTFPWTGQPLMEPDQPVAPTLKSLTASINASVATPFNGGATITDSDWQHRVDGVSAWTDYDITGADNILTITGLLPATEYDVRARFGNSEGNGEWSPHASAVTLGGGFLVMG